jgi:hypothetical protein
VLVRIVGQAPLAATVFSLERLRCGACGQVYTAQEPEGVGPEKYDETAAAMIAQHLSMAAEPHSTGWNNSEIGWGFRYRQRRNGKWSKRQPSYSNRRATS